MADSWPRLTLLFTVESRSWRILHGSWENRWDIKSNENQQGRIKAKFENLYQEAFKRREN